MLKYLTLLSIISCSNGFVRDDDIPIVPILTPDYIVLDDSFPSHAELIAPIIKSIELQEEERLPFDEPRTEVDQQDGSLRPQWYKNYMKGWPAYMFNGDRYPVMVNNKPFVPQVCADFIVDTIDRAAGTWYSSSRKNPGRVVGNFDFRQSIYNERLYPRRVSDLVKYFHNHPDEFQFVFEGLGPQIGKDKQTKSFLERKEVRLGDLIFISGQVPWDKEQEHNHSFFITGFDEDGLVKFVTGNPVFPVKRFLHTEGRRSPKRRIANIIRFRRFFLERLKR